PETPLPPAPPSHDPRWELWLAGSAAFRTRLASAGGPSVGVQAGRTGGVRTRITLELPRATRFVADSRVGAVQLDVAVWWSLGPLRAELGPGVSFRSYRLAEESPTRHVAPIGTAGLGVQTRLGPLTLAPWLGTTVDTVVTRFDLPGDGEAVLSPIQVWTELRIGWRP
ncbi:MAG: hypothetical protein AAF602_17355, partial [Myxococcota bacterium]